MITKLDISNLVQRLQVKIEHVESENEKIEKIIQLMKRICKNFESLEFPLDQDNIELYEAVKNRLDKYEVDKKNSLDKNETLN